MDLRERLRLLKVAAVERAQAQPPGGAAQVPEAGSGPAATACAGVTAPVGAAASATQTPPGPDVGSARAGGCLDGYTVRVGAGEAFYLETRYPIEYLRGPYPLDAIFAIPGSAWELLGRVPTSVDMRHALFFDTETTGLAGGTGTYAFLVGLGYFEGYDFVLKQYFLRDYPEEDALLEALAADLGRFTTLVTFNGKSFDWPLMETRYRMARRRVPLAGAPHLDLLHPARRIWKGRLGQCNLTNLESQVLSVQRTGDVPGSLIPQLYFNYLRSGDATPLQDVILHNRLDILSLVSVATCLGQMIVAPLAPTADGELIPGDDLFALARLFEQRGRPEQALGLYEAAVERGAVAISGHLMMQELARAYKRLKQHDRALALWQQMIESPGAPSYHALVEMAKYYEHVARDFGLAQAMAEQALALAERRRTLLGTYGPATRAELDDAQRRLARLIRKQGG